MGERTCNSCGDPLSPTARSSTLYCRPGCGRKRSSAGRNRARTGARAANHYEFVGVDGEGVDRPDGRHDYNLFSVGHDALYHPDGSALELTEIFGHLWAAHETNPRAVFVGFFLGYDFAQWLQGLPAERAAMLLSPEGQAARQRRRSGNNPVPFPVRWRGWEFDLLADRRFKVRPEGAGSWCYVCDAGPFFQCSLLRAIDPESWPDPVCTQAEYDLIRAGKLARDQPTVPYGTPIGADTLAYNALENDILARTMTRLNQGLTAIGVRLKRTQWYGPGQAAQVWLRETAPQVEGERIRAAVPTGVAEAAIGSYYGGWFELAVHGPVTGESHEYDINSAYPHIISTLPCLLHGRWEHTAGALAATADLELVLATVTGSDPHLGAMLHRTPQGRVLRPSQTRGWFWAHELAAARRAGLIDDIDAEGSWRYHGCGCSPPLGHIAGLYNARLEVGKNSPQGKAMKLVYNSSYGKMAQSVGHPRYANPIYASLITAGCRTMITEAIASHPDGTTAVLMVATDGVYFRTPHPGLHLDATALGAWDHGVKSNLSLFKPGMYWDDGARRRLAEGGNGRLGLKSRGVNEAALASQVTRIDEMWAERSVPWPKVEVVTRFGVVSPRLALHRNDWSQAGRILHDVVSTQSADPSVKRVAGTVHVDAAGLIRTNPWPRCHDVTSTPYERRFGLELKREDEFADIDTLDSTSWLEIKELMNLG